MKRGIIVVSVLRTLLALSLSVAVYCTLVLVKVILSSKIGKMF